MLGRVLLLSLDCSILLSIHTLYSRVLSKEVSSTIFKVSGMMRPGIEPRSPGSLANTICVVPNIWLRERGWMRSFVIFWWCETQFGNSICFCWGCEGDEPYWTERCWARLILFKCYLLNFPLWLEAWGWNPWFSVYLTLLDHQGSCKSNEIFRTIWLLYYAPSPFAQQTFFGCFHRIMAQFELVMHKFPN